MSDLFTNADDQDGTLFDGEAPPAVDPTKDYLVELVGEGKKYKDAAALAKSRVEADAFIERLKNENKGLRSQVNQQVTLEAVLDQLKQSKQTPHNDPPNNQQEEKSGSEVTKENIEQLLDRRLTEREQGQLARHNEKQATDTLVAAFGGEDQAKAMVRQKAAELDLTPQELRAMSQQRPKAFLQLMGVTETQKGSFTPITRSSQNALPTNFNPTGEKTKSYYDKLKRDNPKLYWTPRIQNEEHAQALKLKERFYT